MADDANTLTITEAAKLIARKALSLVELTHSLLERTEEANPRLDAFVTLTAERALGDARRAESEIYSIRERDLRARPGAFGAGFLGRCLPAALFAAADYVQAQRERRRMLAEMEPIYAQFDLLLTAGPYGPAPTTIAARQSAIIQRPRSTTSAGSSSSVAAHTNSERIPR